ncbi:glycosyltransferase family 2 protein [Pontibacter sp. SGAir0037]|uniref:glycosyltransferase family 2 protein n=1 Tax=Pontibacter sp. SGAir0037 TaxID=2571030 RepID=UPI0010CD4753|nr:glycosyltransferase family 2 protein [Pontibacter sp. SGAir0037]QCR22501.1 glycosyl transferase family 2 [Pontibacter sp. SGAir0037]
MQIIVSILNVALYGVAVYLLLNCCYLLFFALAGHIKRKPFPKLAAVTAYRKFCILIPAYKEDVVVLESSRAAVEHAYRGVADVFVIADGLKASTIQKLQEQGAGVIEVNFERSTKGKAMLHALSVLPADEYDVALVLDVDNMMSDQLLEEINLAYEAGYKVVQAHRTAKNKDTAFAYLDTCNEEINNHIYRKGHFAVGLSSALIGSGMAFDYSYLKKLLTGIGETVGEDKELDFRIARDQVKICYLNETYVYDEKIENAKVFTQQRTRWIAAQLEFMKKYAGEGFVQLFKFGNFEFFNKVMQAFLVPRMLLIGVLGIFFLFSFLIPFGPPTSFWFSLLALLSATLFISLPARLYSKDLLKAMVRLPYAVLCMCIALFRINKTKASFLPTPHKTKTVSPSLNN